MQKTISEVFGLKQPAAYKSKQNPDKTSNDSLLIGLELEVENVPNGIEWYQEHAGSFWSVVEDGSLRPRGLAWEFVSRPATLGVALAELRLLLQKMGWNDRNYSDRCSVHVHTNVLDFTQQQVANITLVYPVFEAVLFRFVNHFKKVQEQGYCRDTNLYCIPWADCRMNRNFIEKFFTNPSLLVPDRRGLGTRSWEKYTALNFKPISEHGTVEWRHMHGTADMEKLSMWMNIIGSIMRFCKEQAFDDIVKTIKVMNDVSTYQQFFQSVLGNVLEYKEEYRAAMAEGVVNAKYSLINWEANKGKEPAAAKKQLTSVRYNLDQMDGPEEGWNWDLNVEQQLQPAGAGGNVMIDQRVPFQEPAQPGQFREFRATNAIRQAEEQQIAAGLQRAIDQTREAMVQRAQPDGNLRPWAEMIRTTRAATPRPTVIPPNPNTVRRNPNPR